MMLKKTTWREELSRLTTVRRFLVLAALGYWQGGFTFYSAVVVRVGEEVLGSAREQGFVTRRVTNYLNAAGLAALSICAIDLCADRRNAVRRRLRSFLWAAMSATLTAQAWLHVVVDKQLQANGMLIVDERAFRLGHEGYLIASTVQWILCLAFLLLSLLAWRSEDAASTQ